MYGKNIFFRADADATIGSGHIMRCIALAQTCKIRGARITFITSCEEKGIEQRIRKEGFCLRRIKQSHPDPSDLCETLKITSEHPDSWLILDGYHFSPAYQKELQNAGGHLLVIDDTNHLSNYYCNILLNQNIYADQLNYSGGRDTIYLLGSKHVMLRKEFLNVIKNRCCIPEKARNILVTMGGSDPDNVTLKVVKALNLLEAPEVNVKFVIGSLNGHFSSLSSELTRAIYPYEVIHSADNMPELMSWADLAISAAGSTSWELAFMGIPTILIILADNQKDIGSCLHDMQAAINIGDNARVTAN